VKRWYAPACAVLVVLTITACGDSGGSTSVRDRPEETTTTGTKDSGTAGAYVGLTKQAAIAKAEADGRPWRLGREDGESFMLTQDYNAERVTFEIDDGKVTKASFG
jgi:hypothetical protein